MDLKQIKELMAAMERSDIKKLSIKEKTGFELQLERKDEVVPVQTPPAYPVFYPPPSSPVQMREPEAHPRFPASSHVAHQKIPPEEEKASEKKEEKAGKYVTSPMVGTFYSSPSPEDPPFVKVGDRVEENTVVCIIEAMKVMNEVKAGMSGVIAEVCIENAHPVEFGTKIFRIV